jgi:D-arabinose 1-dehydrogenase-like Zn-dependent alcohol dehydrogenase
MNEMMKADVLHGPYELTVEQVGKTQVKAGEVLIKIKATEICSTNY